MAAGWLERLACSWGSLIDYHFTRWDWCQDEYDYNVPDAQRELALAMGTDTMSGNTWDWGIHDGMSSWIGMKCPNAGFSISSAHGDVLNDYAWGDLKYVMDYGWALVWSIWPWEGLTGHTMAAFGYDDDDGFVLVHSTWDNSLWWFNHEGEIWTVTSNNAFVNGTRDYSWCEITTPVGDPDYNHTGGGEELWIGQTYRVRWSRMIRSDPVWFNISRDGGRTWSDLANAPDDYHWDWVVTGPVTDAARLRMGQPSGARDGMRADFQIAVGPDISINVASLSVTVESTQQTNRDLIISNTGDRQLSWDMVERPDVNWLSEDTVSGRVNPNRSQSCVLTFYGTDLAPGNYSTALHITSNDPDESVIDIPVQMTLLGHDLGVKRIMSPGTSVDSGTTVIPACSTYNWGSYTESYSVRMKISNFYDQTVTVSGHAPATARYVTFPSWLASRNGTWYDTCFTIRARDFNTRNDSVIRRVTVASSHDVGIEHFTITNEGLVDSGTVVAMACSVRNHGPYTETFPVSLRIRNFYSQSVTVDSLAPHTTQYVTFPDWHATQVGLWVAACSTKLASDVNRENDYVWPWILVKVMDVGATRIMAPSGIITPGTIVTPVCSLRHFGYIIDSCPVRLKIGSLYNETCWATILSGYPSAVEFPGWLPSTPGTYLVSCSTELAGDIHHENDKCTTTVVVAGKDVGCLALVAPAGEVDSGAVVTPACTLYNYGYPAQSYPVRMKIGSSYNQTATVTDHAPGVKLYVTFPVWTPVAGGSYSVSCSTELADDGNTPNDRRTRSAKVRYPRDVACAPFLAPVAYIDSGVALVPACSTANVGSTTATYKVRMKIGSGYEDSAIVSSQAPGAMNYVTFASWTPLVLGLDRDTCWTDLANDQNRSNDKKTASFFVSIRDVGATKIISPVGINPHNPSGVPVSCSLYNYGNVPETYQVTFKIGDFYEVSRGVSRHAPHTYEVADFQPPWRVMQDPGVYPTSCSTELEGDMRCFNDKIAGTVTVQARHDVGAYRIMAPSGIVDTGVPFAPACSVGNYGTSTEDYTVRMRISSTTLSCEPGPQAEPQSDAGGQEFVASMTVRTSVKKDAELSGRVAGNALVTANGAFDPVPKATEKGPGSGPSFAILYDKSVTVSSHPADSMRLVTFPICTLRLRGVCVVTCSTQLAGDEILVNDPTSESISVAETHRNVDGGVFYYANGTAVESAAVVLGGYQTDTVYTSSTGSYSLTGLPVLHDYDVTPLKANRTRSGAVSAFDAAMDLQQAARRDTFDSLQFRAGDVSGNSTVSAYDAGLILQYAVGRIQHFPAGARPGRDTLDWAFRPPSRTYDSLTEDQTGQDYRGILYGDPSGNWPGLALPGDGGNLADAVPGVFYSANMLLDENPNVQAPARLAVSADVSAAASRELSASSCEPLASLEFPVKIAGAKDVVSADLLVRYDAQHMMLKAVRTTEATEGFMVAANDRGGNVRVAMAGARKLNGDLTLLELVFQSANSQQPIANGNKGRAADAPGLLQVEGQTRASGGKKMEAPVSPGQTSAECGQPKADVVWIVLNENAPVSLSPAAENTMGERTELPTVFFLNPPRPNPFGMGTSISYGLPIAGETDLRVFDATGRQVKSLVVGPQAAGRYSVLWNGRDDFGRLAASGIYFVRMHADEFQAQRKVTLLRQ
jgi:hypothetical protein